MSSSNTDLQQQAQAFSYDPAEYFGYSYTKMHALPRAALEALQLAALQQRFAALYNTVPMVKKYASKQNISELNQLNDVIPMLFDHTMYKSYPPSLLEKNRFDQLTRWLDKLTSHDLSGLDTSSCEGITDWVELLDSETPLKINHSSGTSGVMSFIPISAQEYRHFGKMHPVYYFQEYGDSPPAPEDLITNMHVVCPTHRQGANAFIRSMDIHAEFIAGNEDRMHTLYPGRLDSDVLYLAARIRAAKIKGNLDSVKINPQMRARQQEFETKQADMATDLDAFFDKIVNDLAGERILMVATWNMVYELAQAGLKRGVSNVFASNSVVVSAGGAKGMVRPDGWEQPVCEFTGVSHLKGIYGMSEISAAHVMCQHNHYHIAPSVIPFVLDPDTSEALPRTGVVTGRAAFYDLLANSHWGGFITGDEITMHWDGDCPCGAKSAYIEDSIGRYSDKRGGDDKISCAATPDAHREAMEFLTQSESAK